MSTPAPIVRSDDCLLHDPSAEIWIGMRTPGTETSERITVLEAELAARGHPFVTATAHDNAALHAVHDRSFLDHLSTVWEQWVAGGYVELGAGRVVPYLMPSPALMQGLPPRVPTALHARVGVYCYDTMTLIGPGTWKSARAAVDCALTAVDLLVAGEPLVYALCRPPGHHVTASAYGGSCYLNNAAIAAQALRGAGFARVAVVDIDAHHGNGTQAIFYDRGDVFYASLHVDPGAGWFPHFIGFADERGRGEGFGFNQNIPLPEGAGDGQWLEAMGKLVNGVNRFGATALVISLGVDAAADDPESPLLVSADGYRAAGRQLASLGLPTVAVQEGGYHLPTLGHLVVTTLNGLAESVT